MKSQQPTPGFRVVPRTGVIYVMSRAKELGYSDARHSWSNLGQGAPETGPIPEANPRLKKLSLETHSPQYSPVDGVEDLRQTVAGYYNSLFRQGKKSQYTLENVSISGGGRSALARVAASLGNINIGHFIPDYTAYEELLSIFRLFNPIPIPLDSKSGYRITSEELRKEILGLGLSAILASNPCNPTGQLVRGEELNRWVDLARRCRCAMIFDEFYSHYIYAPVSGESPARGESQAQDPVSAAAFVKDVNQDPIVIVDGLTKNWRYPGWRISWTVGPKDVIGTVASAGSFLDGGANNPLQQATLKLLETSYVEKERRAVQCHFRSKRQFMLDRIRQLGIQVESEPEGTFYVWCNLTGLPAPLNDGMTLFEEGLKERVITVPGIFFDVNPGQRRAAAYARYRNHCRLSFGPDMPELVRGLNALQRVITGNNRK